MSTSWRFLLTILLAMALSWQGVASAAMSGCEVPGVAHHHSPEGVPAAHPGAHEVVAVHAHVHTHAAHVHEAAEHAAPASHVPASPDPGAGLAPQAQALAQGDAGSQAPEHPGCATCASCCHLLGLAVGMTASGPHIPPTFAAALVAESPALRVLDVPDKPPRA